MQGPFRLDHFAVQLRAGASYCLVFGRAASLARSGCHASYSGVPRRGGTSFGIPPSHVGTVSATIPPVEAQADSAMHAMAAKGVTTLSFMGAITSPNHVESMATGGPANGTDSPMRWRRGCLACQVLAGKYGLSKNNAGATAAQDCRHTSPVL